jgi:hypothetical protein
MQRSVTDWCGCYPRASWDSDAMNVQAIVAAIVGVGSMLAIATGHPPFAAVINDQTTANELTAVIGGIAALISAFSPAIHSVKK